MYFKVILSLSVAIFIISVKFQNVVGNSAAIGAYEILLSKVDSRLNIASKLVDTARSEFRKDLQQMCRNSSCNVNPFCCSRAKLSYGDQKPTDCSDIYNNGLQTNGIYHIWPKTSDSNRPLPVYCDMGDGGGWTVIQRRGNFGNFIDYFYRSWDSYKTGFGNLLREFWIGNDNLYFLTSQRVCQLKVDLTDWDGNSAYAIYKNFWIDEEEHNYTLHIEGYIGTAGDSLSRQNRTMFSTKDRDNDRKESHHCARVFHGAWWHDACMDSNLNGLYLGHNLSVYGAGIIWETFKGFQYSLKEVTMKIRPENV